MDLFELNRINQMKNFAPLAEKLRPKSFDEVLGQEEILKEDGLIMRAMRAKSLPSILLYGPPGTGKTTIAELIAKDLNMNFKKVSAVSSGIKDLREVVDNASEALRMNRGRTILFIDEIHRFSTSQQDFLLPYVEAGDVVLIGATTENPFFAVNKALLSRLILIEVKSLKKDALLNLLQRVKEAYERENGVNISMDDISRDFLVTRADGDARRLINSFEVSVLSGDREGDNIIINENTVRDNFMNQTLKYDNADAHYDTISAFIKSMRGSDPDASIYYLSQMLLAGEDPRFIARRMLIFASEDISLADPNAINIAASCFYATTVIGLPEVEINLAQTAIYLALAPKSNSTYRALIEAKNFIKEHGALAPPIYLRDSHYAGAKTLGIEGYDYPHDYKNDYIKQTYLPEDIKDKKFYFDKQNGAEKAMNDYIRKIKDDQ